MAKDNSVVVRLVKKWPIDEIVGLYQAGGWWSEGDDVSSVKDIISGSFVFAVAVDSGSGRAVGMGRVLSDGVSDAYIQDVIVLPECRKKNVGRMIIVALRNYCLSKNVRWVALVAEEGTEGFYSGLGFKVMKGHTAMKYEGEAEDD
jgi:ribosomal protein S18 acetylase RimI-like enzyme